MCGELVTGCGQVSAPGQEVNQMTQVINEHRRDQLISDDIEFGDSSANILICATAVRNFKHFFCFESHSIK
jgi:hypothetical protein